MEKWGLSDEIKNITFSCSASLNKHKNIKWDLIILDEVHKNSEQNVNFIEHFKDTNCEILLLTGTPISENSEIGERMYKICPISFRKGIDDNIESTLLNDYRIYVLHHDLDSEVKYIPYGSKLMQTEITKYNWLSSAYRNSRFSSQRRKFPFELMRIKQFFNNLKSKENITKELISKIEGKLLVYAGCIEQAEKLPMPTYHSGIAKKERELILTDFINDKFLKMSNVAGIRESANVPNLKYGIIMTPGASESNLEQTIGRFSRLVVGEIARIIILCARGTLEEQWLRKSLMGLDVNKISKINLQQLENLYK